MSVDANDVLFGSGIPAAKFQYPGDVFAGPITKLEAVQARKFDKKTNRPTDELEYWDNGDPKMVAVATLRTQHRDPSDPSDDGQRKLYIASRDMQTKVRDAVKAAGQRKLDVGGFLSVTYTHEAPSEAGPMAKFYAVEYQPAQAAQANAALGGVDHRNGQTMAPSNYGQPVQQPQYGQPVQQGGYYQGVPSLGQMLGQGPGQPVQAAAATPPVQQYYGEQPPAQPVAQAPAAAPVAAPAEANTTSLENLPPEARALVERMLAGQQQS